MDSDQISLYAGMGAGLLILAPTLNFLLLDYLNEKQREGRKIKSQGELETVVEEEARKLGLDPSKICATLDRELTGVHKDGDSYTTYFDLPTLAKVRHELYHIKKRDFREDRKYFFTLRHLLYAERRAQIYGVFGIRL